MSGTKSAFNVADAMGRLMNNKNLYTKLLGKFEADYGGFADQVLAAVKAENLDEAVHLAHTMKGLAGNLGADDLQAASRDLEAFLKNGGNVSEAGSLVEKFTAELQRALQEVRDGVDLG